MLRALALSALVLLGACSSEKIDRLEMRGLGREVFVDAQGSGQYRLLAESTQKEGTFTISTDQFRQLLRQLDPYRNAPEATPRDGLATSASKPCPDQYLTDQGGFYVHWIGPSIDQHYFVDLGCEPTKNAVRNSQLRALLTSLPGPSAR
jgi:hypothetical protein